MSENSLGGDDWEPVTIGDLWTALDEEAGADIPKAGRLFASMHAMPDRVQWAKDALYRQREISVF